MATKRQVTTRSSSLSKEVREEVSYAATFPRICMYLLNACKLSREISGEEREAQSVTLQTKQVPEDCDGPQFLCVCVQVLYPVHHQSK